MTTQISGIVLEIAPPFEAIGELLERHRQAMEMAKDPRPMTLTQRMKQVEELLTLSCDKDIIAWLQEYIPPHLLKEAAATVWDEDELNHEFNIIG